MNAAAAKADPGKGSKSAGKDARHDIRSRIGHLNETGPLMDLIQGLSWGSGRPSMESLAGELASMPPVRRQRAALSLQRTRGNNFVQRLAIQAKLKVGPADDRYEHEADHVATQVMRMTEPANPVQREENEEEIQTKRQAASKFPMVQRFASFVTSRLQRQAKEEEAADRMGDRASLGESSAIAKEGLDVLSASNDSNKGTELSSDTFSAISELLGFATESELDAMLGQAKGAVDDSEEVVEEKLRIPLRSGTTAIQRVAVKDRPKHHVGYQTTVTHGGRTYYHKHEFAGVTKRTKKISGRVVYVKGGRVPTPLVRYRRVNDVAGHLIAHSFGGPPKFTGNFVAMDQFINSAGGDWGRMETYIRRRLKRKNTVAYMSVTPHYAGNSARPDRITVTIHFNREPSKVKYDIQTP